MPFSGKIIMPIKWLVEKQYLSPLWHIPSLWQYETSFNKQLPNNVGNDALVSETLKEYCSPWYCKHTTRHLATKLQPQRQTPKKRDSYVAVFRVGSRKCVDLPLKLWTAYIDIYWRIDDLSVSGFRLQSPMPQRPTQQVSAYKRPQRVGNWLTL